MFDFTALEKVGVLCVNCKTPEESRAFWDEVLHNYQHVSWREPSIQIVITEGHARFGRDVTFELQSLSSGKIDCGWGRRSYFERYRYKVFDFSDLMRGNCDFGELSEDALDLSYLFGGGQTDV